MTGEELTSMYKQLLQISKKNKLVWAKIMNGQFTKQFKQPVYK